MAGNRFSFCSSPPDARDVVLSVSEFGADEGISFLSSFSPAFGSCTFSIEISSGSAAAASCSRSDC